MGWPLVQMRRVVESSRYADQLDPFLAQSQQTKIIFEPEAFQVDWLKYNLHRPQRGIARSDGAFEAHSVIAIDCKWREEENPGSFLRSPERHSHLTFESICTAFFSCSLIYNKYHKVWRHHTAET